MSPPRQQQQQPRADYSRDSDLKRNTLTYSDPTGDEAMRNLLSGGGPFQITAENGFRLFANRESLEYMLLGMKARVSRGGKLWVDPEPPTTQNTPDEHQSPNKSLIEGPYTNSIQKEDH